jgi:hypothetical protein
MISCSPENQTTPVTVLPKLDFNISRCGLVILGLAPCRRYRKGKLWCRACGCVPICRPRRCTRRVCRKVKCTKRVCNTVIRYRIVRYKHYLAYYPGYGPRFVWKTKKVPRKVLVCKIVTNLCTRCRTQSYICGKICKPGPCKRTVSENLLNSHLDHI